MTSFRTNASIGLVTLAFAIGACSGSGTGTTSAPAAAAASASASTPAATGAGSGAEASQAAATNAGTAAGGDGQPVKVCELLPVATVASTTGEPISQAKEDDIPQGNIYNCDYTSADGTSGLVVSVTAVGGGAAYDFNQQANGPGAKPISGVGDKAFSSIAGVYALFGDVLIVVSNVQSDDVSVSLIKALQPKL